ncbi:MAG: VWA domain-containing protein [Treponema sp.]|jgi:Ca-activated chloride channel family protein|nr:VWA domain-containing protein [Treponema sp.]
MSVRFAESKQRLRPRRLLSRAFFFSALALLACALALPGRRSPRVQPNAARDEARGAGTQLVMAFDLSRSMLCEDSAGASGETLSRLDAAAALARGLADAAGDAEIAVAIGKSRGVLAVPLTHDKSSVQGFLRSLTEASASGRGTNIESLVDAAAGAFPERFPSQRRVLVLFTDGEAHEGTLDKALARAAERGAVLCLAGLGSDEGTLVPGLEPPALSARQSALLKKAAEDHKGFYVDGNTPDAGAALQIPLAGAPPEDSAPPPSASLDRLRQALILAALLCLALSQVPRFRFRQGTINA